MASRRQWAKLATSEVTAPSTAVGCDVSAKKAMPATMSSALPGGSQAGGQSHYHGGGARWIPARATVAACRPATADPHRRGPTGRGRGPWTPADFRGFGVKSPV